LRESREASGFRVEKTTTNSDITGVLRFLLNLCHRPAYRFGSSSDPRGRFRNGGFASFMTQTNRAVRDTDRHDAVLHGRKLMRHALRFALVGGGAWVLLESAKALSVF
jgi:hypothetical protein